MPLDSQAPISDSTQQHLVERVAFSYLHQLAAEYRNCSFAVRYLGNIVSDSVPDPRFTIVINRPEVLQGLLSSPDELTLGELLVRGDLDIEGDMEAAFEFAEWLVSYKPTLIQQAELRIFTAVFPLSISSAHGRSLDESIGAVHSRARDRAAIARHYDVSNDFYALWLDPSMMYSSAYFESPEEDLHTAQMRKLDYICRKLRLKPGDRLLDVGCGWGGLVMFAASHYGVYADGISLSSRQIELARERIRSAGLEDRCTVRLCDYRDVNGENAFDKIVSIGMFEHVGEAMLSGYFTQISRLLKPGGVFLNSGIAASAIYKREGRSFMDEYVFPDGELVPLHIAIRQAEESGFEVRDVENLREHYALTLDRWVQRLEERAKQARETTDDATYRTWKLYMAASAHGFRTGRVGVYHMLLSKPDRGRSDLPLTRSDWYCDVKRDK